MVLGLTEGAQKKKQNNEANSVFDDAVAGTIESIATGTSELEVEDKDKDLSIAQVSEQLSQMREDSKEDIAKAEILAK